MLQRLRHRARSEEGFTLIELLVVILIVGILAGVAIPTFLSQTNKANDSNVQSALSMAHTTEAAYRTSNGGYTTDPSALETIEPALTTPVGTYTMSFAYYAPSGTPSATTGYKIKGTDSKDGVTYTLSYDAATGAVSRTCDSPSSGACSATGTWGN